MNAFRKNLLPFVVIFVSSSLATKECFRLNRKGIETFCCNNHVRLNGVCVECEPGTSSKSEEPCKSCSGGAYGRKCDNHCKCSLYERCDRVYGCVLKDDIATKDFRFHTKPQSSEIWKSFARTDSNDTLFSAVIPNDKMTSPMRKGITSRLSTDFDVTSDENDQNTHRSTLKNNDNLAEKARLSNMEIIVIAAGSSVFLFLLVSGFILCVCFYKYKIKQIRKQQTNVHPIPTDSVGRSDFDENSLYDTIDEEALYDDNILIIYNEEFEDKITDQQSDSEISSQKSETSSYLNAYTAVIESCETHAYCTQIEAYESSSISSVGEEMKRDSGYTHPYQQLLRGRSNEIKPEYTEINVHQYLELIDITTTENVSVKLTEKTSLPWNKENQYKCTCNDDGRGICCSSRHASIPCVTNRGIYKGRQSVELRFHPTQQVSLLFELTPGEKENVVDRNWLNSRHMSV